MARYNWNRYWTPFGEGVVMDDAFILPPSGASLLYPNAKLVTTEFLPKSGVVILLGEAGLGKSTELQRIQRSVRDCEFLDLGSIGEESRLQARVREAFAKVADAGLVILDALDETLVQVSRAGEVILEVVRANHSRVGVMISCRTAAWPPTLSARITESGIEVSEFELCVLSRADVELAIPDSMQEELWGKIHAAGAESLAAKPTTLAMLIALAQNKQLPGTRNELYAPGLLKLCEQSEERQDRADPEPGLLSREDCMLIAEKIAGRMLLSGNSVLSRRRDQPGALSYNSLCGGRFARGSGTLVEISEGAIRHVVEHTALFSGRTEGFYGFAHRSFAEFLAARYLRETFSQDQIGVLMGVESEGVHRVAPQLSEVAAWLADMDQGFRTHLLHEDPVIILRSDLSTRPASEKLEVAEALLSGVQADQIYRLDDALAESPNDRRHGLVRQLLARLACPELTPAVRAWLVDKSKSERARQLAIDIAWFAGCSDLSGDLANIVLDPAEAAWLRDGAGYAVSEIGTDQDRDRLRPLLNSTEDEDPEDQLKGIALRALWPHRMGSLEMLESLTPRRTPNFLGSYGGFLYGIKDLKRLADAELPQALVWAKDVRGGLGIGSDVSNIAGMVAYEAWERMDRPGVLDPLADLAVDRMLHHWSLLTVPNRGKDGGWSSEYEQACTNVIRGDDQRRRTLIKACLQRIDPEKVYHFINPGMGGALAFESDFEWAVEQCLQSEGDLAERLAELARSLCAYAGVGPLKNSNHLELWLEARGKSEAVQRHMDWPVAVELGSNLEKEMKRQWRREKDWELRAERQRRVREGRRVQPIELLKDASRKARDEDLRWMPSVIEALQLDENGQWTFAEDLTESYAWTNADEDTKQLALEVCVRYLAEMPLPGRVGAEEDNTLLSEWAAFALVFVSSENLDLLESGIADERVCKLAPHLVEGMNRAVPNGEKPSQALAFLCRKCPVEVTQGVLAVLDIKAGDDHLPSIFGLLPKPLPESLGSALFDVVTSKHAADKLTPHVIEFLIARDVPGAFRYAVQRAGEPGESDADWVRRRRWLSTMARDQPGRVWPELNSMASQGKRWARETLWAAVNSRRFHDDRAAFQDGLSDEQLVGLSKVLFEVFDPDGDRGRSRAGRISDEDEVRSWRGQILNTMVARGTAETVQGLRDLSRSYPQHDWLKHYVLSGTVQKRRYAWVPAQVTQLVEMENDASRRLVRSGSELLTVMVESLRAWEMHTRKHDLVQSLWDDRGKGNWHPKGEEHLSQTLAAWLEQDLRGRCVASGRELQLSKRNSEDGQSGTRVDIDVVAAKDGDVLQPIRAVIEVKGDWHKQVKTAMQDQLVDRYFAEGRYLYGLYVVGRYRDARWASCSHAQAELDAQVSQLKLPLSEAAVRALVLNCSLT